MNRSVVFETPGEIDLRSLTCFGVNTKPNSINPIGHFGTGLKYSVAVLAREGISLVVVTGGEAYTFYRKSEKFRDKDFDFIRMKKETLEKTLRSRTQYSELSYTTELGKNWKLWQVYRELHSNTLDENGTTYIVDDPSALDFQENTSYIIVTHERFVDEYDKRDEIFLPDGLRAAQQNERLQVFDRPSNYIYYRGMRVYDLDKPSKMTYNFLSGVELTEDRTAKNSYMLKHYIEQYIIGEAPPERVEQALAAESGAWEADLSYQYHSAEPSPAFMATASGAQPHRVNVTAAAYAKARMPVKAAPHPLRHRPRPWRVRDGEIVDADGAGVLSLSVDTPLQGVELAYVLELLAGDLTNREVRDLYEEHPGELDEALETGAPEVVYEVADDVPF